MVIYFTHINVLRVIPLFIIYRYIPVIHAKFTCVAFRSLVQEGLFCVQELSCIYFMD